MFTRFKKIWSVVSLTCLILAAVFVWQSKQAKLALLVKKILGIKPIIYEQEIVTTELQSCLLQKDENRALFIGCNGFY